MLGICCYGCLFSWKLVFQHEGEQFELILSASTAHEERQWTSEIVKSAQRVEPVPREPRRYSLLALDVQPFEHSLARKASVHSLSTSCASNAIQHVIIRNTFYPDIPFEPVEGEIERTKLSSPQGAVSLTPKRPDRIRLENLISNIYTSDMLPFPGMVLGLDEKRPWLTTKFNIPANFTRRATSSGAGKNQPPVKIQRNKSRRGKKVKACQEVTPLDDDEKQMVLLDKSSENDSGQINPPKVKSVSVSKESSSSAVSQCSKTLRQVASAQWNISRTWLRKQRGTRSAVYGEA